MLHHFLISMLFILKEWEGSYSMSYQIVLDTSNYRMFVHGSWYRFIKSANISQVNAKFLVHLVLHFSLLIIFLLIKKNELMQ